MDRYFAVNIEIRTIWRIGAVYVVTAMAKYSKKEQECTQEVMSRLINILLVILKLSIIIIIIMKLLYITASLTT